MSNPFAEAQYLNRKLNKYIQVYSNLVTHHNGSVELHDRIYTFKLNNYSLYSFFFIHPTKNDYWRSHSEWDKELKKFYSQPILTLDAINTGVNSKFHRTLVCVYFPYTIGEICFFSISKLVSSAHKIKSFELFIYLENIFALRDWTRNALSLEFLDVPFISELEA